MPTLYVVAGPNGCGKSTLTGHATLRLMADARAAGYRIVLHYICLDSPDQALDRIRNRVALGGHDVLEPEMRRRFARSRANLPAAIAQSDEARLYDNTNPDQPHRQVAMLRGGTWWTAERLPGWAAAVIARMSSPRP